MPRLVRKLATATSWPILMAVLVLSAIGCVSIAAESSTLNIRKQLIFIAIGSAGMFFFQAVNYLEIGRYSWAFYSASLLLIIYTVAPGVPRTGFGSVPNIKGAQAWIDFKYLHLEPAELMKLAYCMVMARYLRFRSNYRSWAGLLPPFLLTLVPLILILKQPALGMGLLLIPALFSMLFVAGAKLRHLIGVMLMGVMMIPVAWFAGTNVPVFKHFPSIIKDYQRNRVRSLIKNDPTDARGLDFQQQQALTAIGSGGLFGKGMGVVPVGTGVPEAHNDMIFALIGEQFGLIGALVLLVAYVVLFTAGVEISGETREPYGKLLAVGIVSMLASQAFLNLSVCLRIAPVTGITLPFVSYGGSSMLSSFLSAGLLLNIGQYRPMIMAKDSFEYK